MCEQIAVHPAWVTPKGRAGHPGLPGEEQFLSPNPSPGLGPPWGEEPHQLDCPGAPYPFVIQTSALDYRAGLDHVR